MAKRKKREVKVVPEEKRLQESLADGTCVIQNEFSMDVIGIPDRAYQGRVKELDAEHSRRFAAMLDSGIIPFPVVVFVSESRCILVDGFHRHDAYRRKGRTSIPAYVFTVPDDQLEHEARLYASMCNQLATKPRGDNDKRKQAEMLFADQACWVWSAPMIGDHCGVHPKTIHSWRMEYSAKNGILIPETFTDKNGKPRPARTRKRGEPVRISKLINNKGTPYYVASIGGLKRYLGTNEDSAQEKGDAIAEKIDSDKDRISLDGSAFIYFLTIRGIRSDFCHAGANQLGISGIVSGQRLVVVVDDASNHVEFYAAIGKLQLFRCSLMKSRPGDYPKRYAIACYHKHAKPSLLDLIRESGIDVMTPEELVASIQAENEQKEAS